MVYGRPAIAAALGRSVTASPTEGPSGSGTHVHISTWNVRFTRTTDEPLGHALKALLLARGSDFGPDCRVDVTVALTAGSGHGCSAALGVAILRALDAQEGVTRSDEETRTVADAWEKTFHGNPSGIDVALATSGGVVEFVRGGSLRRIQCAKPLHFVVADSGVKSSTKTMVEEVARQYARAKARIEQTFDAIAALVRNARLAMEAGDIRALGQLMDLNQGLLSSLMVSTEKLEELCRVARENGALGAKLTGSGGGGSIIALATTADHAAAIAEALSYISPHGSTETIGASE